MMAAEIEGWRGRESEWEEGRCIVNARDRDQLEVQGVKEDASC